MRASESSPSPWLFSRNDDLWAFGGSAGLAFLLLGVGHLLGLLDQPLPLWVWVLTVVGIDVAHVHATWFRIYLEPGELRRRPLLYTLLPLGCLVGGVALHLASSRLFWSVLAYIAVFHFVRQPYGWVSLYRAKAGETGRLDRWIDTGAIYAATLWPLLWWHGNLPRAFVWFVPDDFPGGVPARLAELTFPIYLALLLAFVVRQAWRYRMERRVAWGKMLVVSTTAATWYVGIVALDSDFAFTVTNVLPHGLPYLLLVWRYGQRHPDPLRRGVTGAVWREGAWLYLLLLAGLAFLEEWGWDATVWHDRPALFGEGLEAAAWQDFLVPLLALPQLTHYVLDGFIWRRRSNPELKRQVEGERARQAS